MMKKRRKSILLLATMGVLLMSGCSAKEGVQEEPNGTFADEALVSVEEQTTAANETQSITSDEARLEIPIQSEESARAESTSEPESTSESESTSEPESTSESESTSEPELGSEQETKTTQMAPDKEVTYMDIVHIFKPYEQAVEISLQIPEDWKYAIWDVEEESPDWGYSVDMYERDDASFSIFGQHGTLTADGYSNGPKSFQTSQGLTGQYSWDEYMLDDESPAIQGMIVFDTELAGFYGVSFNMPKNVYSENKDIIDQVFQSIAIKEAQ